MTALAVETEGLEGFVDVEDKEVQLINYRPLSILLINLNFNNLLLGQRHARSLQYLWLQQLSLHFVALQSNEPAIRALNFRLLCLDLGLGTLYQGWFYLLGYWRDWIRTPLKRSSTLANFRTQILVQVELLNTKCF